MRTLADAMKDMGTKFGKMNGNELIFQLKDLETKEDFKIWNNKENKFIETTYVPSATGEQIEIEKVKYFPAKIMEEFFPGLRKTTQYIRTIIVNGEPQRFGFKKTANDNLNTLITTLKATGQDPTKFMFKMEKSGTGIKTEYKISIIGQATNQPQQALNLNINKPNEQQPLIPIEQKLIEAYKNGIPKENHNITDFIMVGKNNGLPITEERLTWMYNTYIKQ